MGKRRRVPGVLLYPEDLFTGTMLMSDSELGTYVRLLCQQVILGGMLPRSLGDLSKISLIDRRRFAAQWQTISCKFEEHESGGIHNPRMTEEMEKAQAAARVNRDRAKKAARARWSAEGSARGNAPSIPASSASAMPRARVPDPEPDPDPREEEREGRDRNPADDSVRALPRRAVIPPELLEGIPGFVELWADRLKAAGRKRPSVSAEGKQLETAVKWLRKYGAGPVVAEVEKATRGGYQGCFFEEPKTWTPPGRARGFDSRATDPADGIEWDDGEKDQ